MDIVSRTYAPSLHRSSAKTLFDMDMCSKKIDYVLIAVVSVAIIWVLRRQYLLTQEKKYVTG